MLRSSGLRCGLISEMGEVPFFSVTLQTTQTREGTLWGVYPMVVDVRQSVSCLITGLLLTAECRITAVPERKKDPSTTTGGINYEARDNSLTVQTTP